MKDKKIVILMSTYNGEKYISDQIESIMRQKTSADILLKIRDDGSKDDTCEIIEEKQSKYPGKIILIKGENIGYNNSFFYLIKNISGFEYYALSDQDDVWLEDKIETAIKNIEEQDYGGPLLYASRSFLVYDDLVPQGQTREMKQLLNFYNTIIQNICPGHTQVFNSNLLLLLQKKIDVDQIYVYDSWICNIAMLYGKVIFDNNSHTYYRQHSNNQLGYGKGNAGRLIASFRHAISGDGNKYKNQISYFVKCNRKELEKQDYYDEINQFLSANKFIEKIRYIRKAKLFRQNRLETVCFYISFLLGKF